MLALTEPFAQTNASPSQCEMPPLTPLHGKFRLTAGCQSAPLRNRSNAQTHARTKACGKEVHNTEQDTEEGTKHDADRNAERNAERKQIILTLSSFSDLPGLSS